LAHLSDGAADLSTAGLARADEARSPRDDPRRTALDKAEILKARAAKIVPPSRDFH
jgi:hypothetical protein